jgi:hypothetical protein
MTGSLQGDFNHHYLTRSSSLFQPKPTAFGTVTEDLRKVSRVCHGEPFFGEAISEYGEEIASTGAERRFRNDTIPGLATLTTL